LLVNALTRKAIAEPFAFPCLSMNEMYAEKLRAGLSWREPAIRDFYDIDFAVRYLGLDLLSLEMIDLVRRKLSIPGNNQPDVSDDRIEKLKAQLESELKPVLRDRDFVRFDLREVVGRVGKVADLIQIGIQNDRGCNHDGFRE